MIGLGRPLGLRQVPLHLGWAPPRLELSQAAVPFKVAVIDVRGNPFSGVKVTLGNGQSAVTDSDGVATFPAQAGRVTATLDIDGLRIIREGDGNQTLFVDLPICGTPKILTKSELVALVAGAAMTAAGTYWKTEIVSITGEVLIGASLFTAIYRHSCVW